MFANFPDRLDAVLRDDALSAEDAALHRPPKRTRPATPPLSEGRI